MVLTARSTWVVTLSGLMALLAPSCGGDGFNAGSSTDGGQAGAGLDADAGQGGAYEASAGQGGASDAGGDANEGGVSTGNCSSRADCNAGQFCREGSCAACADLELESLAFGTAQPFDLINSTATDEGLRLARRTADGLGLVYVRDFFGGALWVTSDAEVSAGAAITKTDVFETGPLPFPQALPEPLKGYDFFFSRRLRVGAEPLLTRLFGAKLATDGTLTDAVELPAPFNSDQVVASYGLALSSTRAVWARNKDGQLGVQLVTSPLPPSGEPTPLSLALPDNCGFASELDYAPWFTPDGKLLLFAARRVDEGCKPSVDAVSHIYALELSAAGQPVGAARVLSGLLPADVRQTDASLSPDFCELVFSAQDDGPMRLYHAERVR